MMMKKLATLAVLCGWSLSATAGVYGGVDFMQITYSEDGVSEEAKPTAIRVRLGNRINENLAIEGFFGTGLGDDSVNVQGTTVDVEIDQLLGFYLKGIFPASDAVSIFAMLGYTKGEATFSVPGFSTSEDESDMSFGFGGEFKVSDTVGIVLTYEQIADKSDFDVAGVTAGLNFQF